MIEAGYSYATRRLYPLRRTSTALCTAVEPLAMDGISRSHAPQGRTMKRNYGTATSEEIHAGFAIATAIAETIKAIPNPAVQNMVKKLIALIHIEEQ